MPLDRHFWPVKWPSLAFMTGESRAMALVLIQGMGGTRYLHSYETICTSTWNPFEPRRYPIS